MRQRDNGPEKIGDLFQRCDALTRARANVPVGPPIQEVNDANSNSNSGPAEISPTPPVPDSDPAPNSPEDLGFARRPELPKEVLGFCRSCNRPIYWVRLKGKPHPVERGTDPKGNIALTLHTGNDSVAAELVEVGTRPNLHLSHFAVCKYADQWRSR